jgi:hypothetical protein
MKNFLLFLVLGLLLSCESVEDSNNPGFQIVIDNVNWNATQVKAFLNPNGSVLIKANTTNETFDILVPSRQVRTYDNLGLSSTVNASYTYQEEGVFLNYVTGNNIGGSGTLKIKRHPNVDSNIFISGELTFQGIQTSGDESFPEKRNFIRGVFYNIPIQIAP